MTAFWKFCLISGLLLVIWLVLGHFTTMLIFMLTFQTVAYYGMIREIRLYRRSKRWPVVIADLESVEEIAGDVDNPTTYQSVFKFSLPATKQPVLLDLNLEEVPQKRMEVLVNIERPEQSVLKHQFGLGWVGLMVMKLSIVSAFFVVDYLLWKEVVKP